MTDYSDAFGQCAKQWKETIEQIADSITDLMRSLDELRLKAASTSKPVTAKGAKEKALTVKPFFNGSDLIGSGEVVTVVGEAYGKSGFVRVNKASGEKALLPLINLASSAENTELLTFFMSSVERMKQCLDQTRREVTAKFWALVRSYFQSRSKQDFVLLAQSSSALSSVDKIWGEDWQKLLMQRSSITSDSGKGQHQQRGSTTGSMQMTSSPLPSPIVMSARLEHRESRRGIMDDFCSYETRVRDAAAMTDSVCIMSEEELFEQRIQLQEARRLLIQMETKKAQTCEASSHTMTDSTDFAAKEQKSVRFSLDSLPAKPRGDVIDSGCHGDLSIETSWVNINKVSEQRLVVCRTDAQVIAATNASREVAVKESSLEFREPSKPQATAGVSISPSIVDSGASLEPKEVKTASVIITPEKPPIKDTYASRSITWGDSSVIFRETPKAMKTASVVITPEKPPIKDTYASRSITWGDSSVIFRETPKAMKTASVVITPEKPPIKDTCASRSITWGDSSVIFRETPKAMKTASVVITPEKPPIKDTCASRSITWGDSSVIFRETPKAMKTASVVITPEKPPIKDTCASRSITWGDSSVIFRETPKAMKTASVVITPEKPPIKDTCASRSITWGDSSVIFRETPKAMKTASVVITPEKPPIKDTCASQSIDWGDSSVKIGKDLFYSHVNFHADSTYASVFFRQERPAVTNTFASKVLEHVTQSTSAKIEHMAGSCRATVAMVTHPGVKFSPELISNGMKSLGKPIVDNGVFRINEMIDSWTDMPIKKPAESGAHCTVTRRDARTQKNATRPPQVECGVGANLDDSDRHQPVQPVEAASVQTTQSGRTVECGAIGTADGGGKSDKQRKTRGTDMADRHTICDTGVCASTKQVAKIQKEDLEISRQQRNRTSAPPQVQPKPTTTVINSGATGESRSQSSEQQLKQTVRTTAPQASRVVNSEASGFSQFDASLTVTGKIEKSRSSKTHRQETTKTLASPPKKVVDTGAYGQSVEASMTVTARVESRQRLESAPLDSSETIVKKTEVRTQAARDPLPQPLHRTKSEDIPDKEWRFPISRKDFRQGPQDKQPKQPQQSARQRNYSLPKQPRQQQQQQQQQQQRPGTAAGMDIVQTRVEP
uniref:Protein kinase domain-containing protein n=1 Tax=Macrostomum lignano TaxID=282301 RepID=A0A1I8HW06_9PLAT